MTEINSVLRRQTRFVAGGSTEVNKDGLEWWERISIPIAPDDRSYVVEKKFEGRIDLISALFLGESRHWWVIAMFNNILDPYNELTEGRILYIPSAERVATLLAAGRTGGEISTREVPTTILPIV